MQHVGWLPWRLGNAADGRLCRQDPCRVRPGIHSSMGPENLIRQLPPISVLSPTCSAAPHQNE